MQFTQTGKSSSFTHPHVVTTHMQFVSVENESKTFWIIFLRNSLKKKKKKKDKSIYVTLDHKTSLKSLGYICSKRQKYIVWVKIINFSFMPKIIRILSKDHELVIMCIAKNFLWTTLKDIF